MSDRTVAFAKDLTEQPNTLYIVSAPTEQQTLIAISEWSVDGHVFTGFRSWTDTNNVIHREIVCCFPAAAKWLVFRFDALDLLPYDDAVKRKVDQIVVEQAVAAASVPVTPVAPPAPAEEVKTDKADKADEADEADKATRAVPIGQYL